ncbi:MAG: hypothetical protein AAGF93_25025 [Cyanobacteria bacterium P01_H01_bin.105]
MKRLVRGPVTSFDAQLSNLWIRHKFLRLRAFLCEYGLFSLAQAILIVLFISSPGHATADFAIVNHTTKQVAWVRDYGDGWNYIPVGWETAGEEHRVNKYINELGYRKTQFTYQVETLGFVLVLGIGTGVYKMCRRRKIS